MATSTESEPASHSGVSDSIVTEFATYEDFLDSQITPTDLYYLEVKLEADLDFYSKWSAPFLGWRTGPPACGAWVPRKWGGIEERRVWAAQTGCSCKQASEERPRKVNCSWKATKLNKLADSLPKSHYLRVHYLRVRLRVSLWAWRKAFLVLFGRSMSKGSII